MASTLLEKTYVVGVQNRFSPSLRVFADAFNWRRLFVTRVNVGALRGGPHEAMIDDETCSLIRSYNRLDRELHAHSSRRLEGKPSGGAGDRAAQPGGPARSRRGQKLLRRRKLRGQIAGPLRN